MMNKKHIEEVFNSAIEKLKKNDSELLELGVSERAVMFHFARYMREEIPENYHVDCEYNRHLKDVKQLYFLKQKLGTNSHNVIPDILVHQRNTDNQNLLVVELKKFDSDTTDDNSKLLAFKSDPYKYEFAVQLIIGSKGNPSDINYNFI